MDYSKGFSAEYYAHVVDPITWRDRERIDITGGTIDRSSGGLRNSADIDTVDYRQERELYIRVYLDARQGGSNSHDPLFTGLACSPEQDLNGVLEQNKLECYSVLKAAEDMLLPPGYYTPIGIPGTQIISELLSPIPAPVVIEGTSPELRSYIVAEDGENRLSMSEKVLDAIGWRMTIDGYGRIIVSAYPTEPAAVFDPIDNDVIEPSIKIKYDWYRTPNVFRAIDGGASAVARDDSPDSENSTVSRGREIWAEDSDSNLNTGESLAEYAERRLHELQQVAYTASYDRRFDPGVFVDSVVRLNYPRQRLSGLFRVTSQKIELGYGARTSEEVERI